MATGRFRLVIQFFSTATSLAGTRSPRGGMVVDDVWTSVGSTNFDNRSFRLNDEANLNVFSEQLAREQIQLIDEDIRQSRRMGLKKWRSRTFGRRVNERLALLLRSQL